MKGIRISEGMKRAFEKGQFMGRDKDRQRQSGASGTLSTTAVGWGARTGCFGLPEWVAATSKLHPWSPW